MKFENWKMQRENCETTQAPEQNRDTRASAVSTVSKSKERKKTPHRRGNMIQPGANVCWGSKEAA